jgi:DNA-binding NarL/FixJ family response regulator
MSSLRLAVIDDNPGFLHTICDWFARDPRFEIVGRFAAAPDAVTYLERLRPEVVVVDWRMPGCDGLAALPLLKRHACAPRVVVTSLVDSALLRERALSAGADAFLPKDQLASLGPDLVAGLISAAQETAS